MTLPVAKLPPDSDRGPVWGAAGPLSRDPVPVWRLHQALREVVRPQFQVEVLVFQSDDLMLGGAKCVVTGCGRPGQGRQLCGGHYLQWRRAGRPVMEEWVAHVNPELVGRTRPLRTCAAQCCRRGAAAAGLCKAHWAACKASGLPQSTWLPSAVPVATYWGTCVVTGCSIDAERSTLCSSHMARWRNHKSLSLKGFVLLCEQRGFPSVDMSGLHPQVRLEVQYGVQTRVDARTAAIKPQYLNAIVQTLIAFDVDSLVNYDVEELVTRLKRRTRGGTAQALLRWIVARVLDLVQGTGFDNEYDRDVWDMNHLVPRAGHTGVRRLRFDRIPQTWLRALAKRWIRHRISCDFSHTTFYLNLSSIARFGQFLDRVDPGSRDESSITRAVLERWLAALVADPALHNRSTRNSVVSDVKIFLEALGRYDWAPRLPATAALFRDDFARPHKPLPRFVSEFIMAQLEAPAALARYPGDRERLITKIMIATGLRISSAINLAGDCLVRDSDNAAYLRYRNTKMRRDAMVPIEESLAQDIIDQRRTVRERWPNTQLLFPRPRSNPDGLLPISYSYYRETLRRWLTETNVVDEAGAAVNVTAHQFRHTLATRLINNDVPLEIVQMMLDHSTPTMTMVYSRISAATLRKSWENATKVNIAGDIVNVDPDSPLADAQWMKHSLGRAKMALPNGYCGLPLQQTCPHANACLDCSVFITTAEFLPQHRDQLDTTRKLIATAKADGRFRLVEMNERVETSLHNIITALETPLPDAGASPVGAT